MIEDIKYDDSEHPYFTPFLILAVTDLSTLVLYS